LANTFRIEFDEAALGDLADIRDFLTGARDADFAGEFLSRIFDWLSDFDTLPRRGTRRDDVRPGLRIIGWRRTLTVAFAVDEARETVTIFAVLYRGRDVDTVLRDRNDRGHVTLKRTPEAKA
jgi:toxin ParE1/3/4